MKFIYTILSVIFINSVYAQNTVGLIDFDSEVSTGGVNLIFPLKQPSVFLINECGQLVHQWDDLDEFVPGTTAYLLPNGNLLKSKKSIVNIPGNFSNGGSGGIIELLNWDNELLYSVSFLDSLQRSHHDICPLPNGNFLSIVWEVKNLSEIVSSGRDTSIIEEYELWPDKIVEVDPSRDSIVWEWHMWDHIIQDFDSTKINYGVIADNPGRIDINFGRLGFAGRGDFGHTNSIDYNPVLDQILLSVPYFGEIWIIDHSTSTEEAATSQGGVSGKGGDLLFRWGNPTTYNNGSLEDQKLFFQHNARWVQDPLLEESRYWGMIAVFNNRSKPQQSTVNFIRPIFNSVTKSYEELNGSYLPIDFSYTIDLPLPQLTYSSGMSSIQVLKKDNLLISSAQSGFSFEMDIDFNIVWSYRVPMRNGVAISQGTSLSLGDNTIFDIKRYPLDYPAFQNQELTPYGYVELNPEESLCTPLRTIDEGKMDFKVFPVPFENNLTLQSNGQQPIESVEIYNTLGDKVISNRSHALDLDLDLSHLNQGIYFIQINNSSLYKIVK